MIMHLIYVGAAFTIIVAYEVPLLLREGSVKEAIASAAISLVALGLSYAMILDLNPISPVSLFDQLVKAIGGLFGR